MAEKYRAKVDRGEGVSSVSITKCHTKEIGAHPDENRKQRGGTCL
jgi:hypothetical protein